jgi:hypothetical protein
MRVWNVPHTKGGKLPTANYQNAHIRKTGPRHIRITTKDKSAEVRNERRLENGMVAFTTTLQGRFDPIVFARSLYKIALGMVAFKQDPGFARSSRFDRARQFICDGKGFPNNLLMNTVCQPHHEIRLMYNVLAEGTPFAIDFYGIVFVFNLEPTPVVELNEQIKEHFQGMNFVLHSLTPTDTTRLRREKRHGADSQDSP